MLVSTALIRKGCQGYGARSSDRNSVIERPRRGFHIDTLPDPCKFRYVREVRLDRACTPTSVISLQLPRLRSLRAVRVERHRTPRSVMDVHSPKSRLVSVVRLDRDCTPRSDKEVHSRTLRCVREVRLDRVSTAPRFVMEVQLRMSRRFRFARFGRNCMPWSVIRPHMLRSRCSSLVKPERNCTPWSVIVVFGSPMK